MEQTGIQTPAVTAGVPIRQRIRRISFSLVLLYSAAAFGQGIFYGFNNAQLNLFLEQVATQYGFAVPAILAGIITLPLVIGLLSSTNSLEGAVIQPVIGAISDRIWTPFGRRRPFFLTIPFVALIMLLVPHLQSFWIIGLAIFTFSLLFTIALDPYGALMADITPVEQRGFVSAIVTVFSTVGQAAIVLLGVFLWKNAIPGWSFYVVAAVILIAFVITFAGVPEQRGHIAHTKHYTLRQYAQELVRYPDAFKFFLMRSLQWFGINAILPYLTLYATETLHFDSGQAQLLFFVLLISTLVFAVPAGWLGDRFGIKRIFGAGLLIIFIAGLVATQLRTLEPIVIALCFAGLGNAFYSVLAYPLLTRLVPPSRIGLFTGIDTSFRSIAIPVSILIASTAISTWGYGSIFYLLAFFMCTALLMLQTFSVGPGVPDPEEEQTEEKILPGA